MHDFIRNYFYFISGVLVGMALYSIVEVLCSQ
jgi:hypothetical protein